MLLKRLAMEALIAVVKPLVDEAKDAALNAAQDTVRENIAKKMSIKEWAKVICGAADNIKKRIADENGYRYVGGKLKFTFSKNSSDAVTASFQLYFMDDMGKWHLADAENDIPATLIKSNSLDELGREQEIVYDIN